MIACASITSMWQVMMWCMDRLHVFLIGSGRAPRTCGRAAIMTTQCAGRQPSQGHSTRAIRPDVVGIPVIYLPASLLSSV